MAWIRAAEAIHAVASENAGTTLAAVAARPAMTSEEAPSVGGRANAWWG